MFLGDCVVDETPTTDGENTNHGKVSRRSRRFSQKPTKRNQRKSVASLIVRSHFRTALATDYEQ